MKSPVEAIQLARNGGNVKRYHTVPLIGEQTNAAHTFHMLVLLDQMVPGGPSMLLVRAVLYHDVSEIVTGDAPWPAKRLSQKLKSELHRMEEEVLSGYDLPATLFLSEENQTWFRLVDALECCFFAVDQARLGHRGMDEVFWNGHGVADREYKQLKLNPEYNQVKLVMEHLRAEAGRVGISPF